MGQVCRTAAGSGPHTLFCSCCRGTLLSDTDEDKDADEGAALWSRGEAVLTFLLPPGSAGPPVCAGLDGGADDFGKGGTSSVL